MLALWVRKTWLKKERGDLKKEGFSDVLNQVLVGGEQLEPE